jgi:hypothetical protein
MKIVLLLKGNYDYLFIYKKIEILNLWLFHNIFSY